MPMMRKPPPPGRGRGGMTPPPGMMYGPDDRLIPIPKKGGVRGVPVGGPKRGSTGGVRGTSGPKPARMKSGGMVKGKK